MTPIMVFLNFVFVLMITGVLMSIGFVHYKLIGMLHKNAHIVVEPKSPNTQNSFMQSSISQDASYAISQIKSQATITGNKVMNSNFEVQIANILHQQEKVINHQARIMSLTFSLCWGSYFMMVLITIITQTPADRRVDAFLSLGPILNSTLNPVLLYLLDNRVKSSVKQILN
jgi:hypothetical protein